MVRLKEIYNLNGYKHEIVWRDESHAITKLTDDTSGKFVCYEAFQIQVRHSGHPNSKAEYPRETTPRDEMWGRKGYSVWTLEQAHIKIAKLKEKYANTKS